MTDLVWNVRSLSVPGAEIAVYEGGAGRTVVFLHGGPGDDAAYLRPLAGLLGPKFRAVLYDQRGSGGSALSHLDETTLSAAHLIADLEALRTDLGEEKLTLLGHSWGASLALLYAGAYPARVERLALIGLGPLSEALGKVAGANLHKPLTASERAELADLQDRRQAALGAGDFGRYADLMVEIVTRFYARGWFYSPQAAERFAAQYPETYAHNPVAHRLIWRSFDTAALWEALPRVGAETLVLYGLQDFEPITQAYLLRDRMPRAVLHFINECGHVPWLEQPGEVRAVLADFLNRS